MEDKNLHEKTAQSKGEEIVDAASYTILSFPAAKLPSYYISMIYSKWLRSLRYGNDAYKKIKSKTYYDNYHDFIENLLKKPDSIIRLAVLSNDHDVVLGFAVSREDVLDYIYVHQDYRNNKIGAHLIPEGITTFSQITKMAKNIWQTNAKYKMLQFNPFA